MVTSADISDNATGYNTVAFSQKFQVLVKKQERRVAKKSRPITLSEVQHLMDTVSETMGLAASRETVERVLRHNPEMIRVMDGGTNGSDLLAYLPLTAKGLDALTNGRLDRASPDLSHLSRSDERPAALYLWCVHAPRNFVSVVGAMTAHFSDIAPDGVPLFASAANAHAARIFDKLGFRRATDSFPRIASDILVVLPNSNEDDVAPSEPKTIATRVGRTIEDVMRVFAIRAATYMSEQSCPYDEEFDGNDFCAAHIIGEIDGEPAGCIRIRFFADFVKFERLAVRPEFRNSSMAFRLVRAAIEYARRKGFHTVYGHARADLISFWQRFGFKALADRPAFAFSGVPYVEMAGEIPRTNRALHIGDPPLQLIRPEGLWDSPGPLDGGRLRRAAA